jgi:hypothetical protein
MAGLWAISAYVLAMTGLSVLRDARWSAMSAVASFAGLTTSLTVVSYRRGQVYVKTVVATAVATKMIKTSHQRRNRIDR